MSLKRHLKSAEVEVSTTRFKIIREVTSTTLQEDTSNRTRVQFPAVETVCPKYTDIIIASLLATTGSSHHPTTDRLKEVKMCSLQLQEQVKTPDRV